MDTEKNRACLVEALRSGKYQQGHNHLRIARPDQDLYCCHGVACEVFQELTGEGSWSETSEGSVTFILDGEEHYVYMPVRVQEFFGLVNQSKSAVSSGAPESSQLADFHNDLHRESFDEIADVIESAPRDIVAR